MVPPLSQKVAFFTNSNQGLFSKVRFFLIFSQFYELAFFDKMLALSNKKSTFVLVSGFFGCCIFTTLFKCTFQILGGCQGRRTGVGVTTVSNSLILGGWMTKVLKNGDKK